MRIAVLSDTHSKKLPEQLLKALEKSDLIIHVGDFCAIEDFEALTRIKEVKAVHGNMDDAVLQKKLPAKEIFEVEGAKVGLFHGLGPSRQVIEYVKEEFKKDKLDAVVFGHSHQPFNKVINGVLYFNPGSPTDKFSASTQTYGILEINGKEIKGEIKEIKEK